MSHDVFISYSGEDREEAQRIREFLQTRGIRCWIDKKNLRFARHYDREIEQAIRRSRVVVWLASRRSTASDYVKFEISTALNYKKPLGPVYLEPMDPAALPPPFNLKLAAVQGIEYHAGPTEENLEKLAEELRALVRSGRRRELALGAEDRMGSLVVDSRQTGGTGHLGPDGDGSLPQVVVRSGQSLVEEDAALRPRGIKIDVEGAEYEVLQGLGSLLDEATLRFIGMEIHFARLDAMGRQDDPALIERLLVGRGFSVRWTDSSHLVATRVSG